MGEISSHGSNPLPKGLSSSRTRPKENTDRVQMPHRPLQVMSEHSQKHIESDNWFKEANQHVTSQLDGLGDDAPYLLPEDHDRGQSGDKQSSSNRLGDPILSYMRTHDSERENEELRGIIDDLTLDIKKLKQKLRRYKERDPPRLQGDKLFDVRTYGLPRQKKRQLEQILQQFAAEISGGSRFPRERAVRKKVKHLRDNAPVSDENTRKAMVAMLFQQHLGLLAVKASHQHPTDPSSGSDTWYDLDKIISSIKNTISNIDVDFSREALKEYGAALEISADGRHVRWQTSNLIRPLTHDHVLGDQISDFPKKTMIHQKDVLGLAESKTKLLHPPDTTYTPYALKTHKNELDDDVLSVNSSGSEMSFQVPFGNGNGHAPDAGLPAHKMSHEKLTYYKNATFYIDGHGDRPDKVDFQPRKQSWVDGVGEKRKRQSSPSLSSQQQRRHSNKTPAHRFHFYPNEKDPALNLSQCSSPDVSLAEEPMTSVPEGHTAVPLELAASGVGDVTPGDNFAVHVVMKHVPVSSSDDANNKQGKDSESSRISHRPFHDVTPESDQRNGGKLFKTYVVTATHEKLAPSSLPPATCGIFSSSSSDDGGNNEEEDGEESANEMDDVYEEQAQMKLHNMPRDGLSRVGAINGESPASMQSIEKWNAQVVASLANDKENGAFNGQAF